MQLNINVIQKIPIIRHIHIKWKVSGHHVAKSPRFPPLPTRAQGRCRPSALLKEAKFQQVKPGSLPAAMKDLSDGRRQKEHILRHIEGIKHVTNRSIKNMSPKEGYQQHLACLFAGLRVSCLTNFKS